MQETATSRQTSSTYSAQKKSIHASLYSLFTHTPGTNSQCCASADTHTMADDQARASANESELTVTVVGAVMIVLSVVAVVFRFYTRFHLKAVLWWDDWMALAAVVSAVAAGALVLAGEL